MKKFIQQKLKDQKGMTLIELLAVIVIIAIIAAIAIPAIGNIIENSRVGAIKSDYLNAISAAELFALDNPSDTDISLADLTTAGTEYLEDQGALSAFNYNPTTNLVTAGTATISDVIIAVATPGADRDDFNALANNSATGTTIAGITLTR